MRSLRDRCIITHIVFGITVIVTMMKRIAESNGRK